MDAGFVLLEHEPSKLQNHFDSINGLQPLPNSQLKIQFKQGSEYNIREIKQEQSSAVLPYLVSPLIIKHETTPQ